MFLLSEHDGVLQMEMEQNDQLVITRLKERMLDVVVQNVHLVPPHGGVPEAIDVGLQGSCNRELDESARGR